MKKRENLKFWNLNLTFMSCRWRTKKKVWGVLNGSFLSSFVEGGNNLFNFFKGGNLRKKVWGTPKVIY